MISMPSGCAAIVRNLGNSAPILSVSAKSGGNLSAWFDWLRCERAKRLRPTPAIA